MTGDTAANIPQPIDRNRFEALYRLYAIQLRDYCYHHMQDLCLAEEVVHDIFLAVWERREDIGPVDGGFIKYLTRAAKRKIFDFHRHCASVKRHLDRCQVYDCRACCNTEDTVYYNELTAGISRFIAALPCRCQEVYRLAYEEELSKPEIAARLGISEKTVEYHLYKAVHLIRGEITKFGNS